MKKQTFTVPTYALAYLCNRDKSGLSLFDLKNCQTFERQNKIVGFLSADGEEFEAKAGDPWHIFTKCTQATFEVRYTSDELFARIVCRVDTSRGAPMGRQDSKDRLPVWWDALWKKTPHFDRRVPLDSGAYDKGGAYWGFPGNIRVKMSKDGQMWEFYRSWSRIDDSLKLHP